MSTFTHAEIQYLNSQPLGRIATVDPHGRPHVMPVAVFYDPETESVVIGIAGDTAASKKFRDAQHWPDVAIVVDDLAAIDPWTPRGIEIRGRAETHIEGGQEVGKRLGAPFPFHAAWIRIRPRRVLVWGIDTGPYELTAMPGAAEVVTVTAQPVGQPGRCAGREPDHDTAL
jgi:pyridoxamine 5'-phosphate oxidase family protein